MPKVRLVHNPAPAQQEAGAATSSSDTRNDAAFGELVSTLIEERGMTQADLAEEANVSAAGVSAWLAGKRRPRPGSLGKLARALTSASGSEDDEQSYLLFRKLMQLSGHLPADAEIRTKEIPDSLRNNPRFQALLATLRGLTEDQQDDVLKTALALANDMKESGAKSFRKIQVLIS